MKKKKVVVITGASSGIGLATANYLLSKDFTVYGIALEKPEVENFKCFVCDITDTQKVEGIFNEIFEIEKQIDYVVNNAGIGISGAIEHTSDKDIDKQFMINVNSLIKICRVAVPYLKQSQGRIVNIGSVAGFIPIPFQACYSASKAAVENFSQCLSLELKPFKVKVITVRPGDTKTNFTKNRIKNENMEDSSYNNRIVKSISRMEKDEKNGMPPISVSKVIYKQLTKRNPKLVTTVGFAYKLIYGLSKILPKKVVLKIVQKMYG